MSGFRANNRVIVANTPVALIIRFFLDFIVPRKLACSLLLFAMIALCFLVVWLFSPSQVSECTRKHESEIATLLEKASAIRVYFFPDVYVILDRNTDGYTRFSAGLKSAVKNNRSMQHSTRHVWKNKAELIDGDDRVLGVVFLNPRAVGFKDCGWAFPDVHIEEDASDYFTRKTYRHPDGSIRAKGEHDLGKKHGDWVFFYQNGSVLKRGRFQWGVEVGVWEFFDPKGELEKTIRFPDIAKPGGAKPQPLEAMKEE